MLANKHPDEFKIHLDTIMNDTIKRLDDGPIGKPSATRLRKFVEDGFFLQEHLTITSTAGAVLRRCIERWWTAGAASSPFGGSSSGQAMQDPFRRRQQSNFSNNSGQKMQHLEILGASSGSFVKLFALRIGAISACFRRRFWQRCTSPSPFGGNAAPSPAPSEILLRLHLRRRAPATSARMEYLLPRFWHSAAAVFLLVVALLLHLLRSVAQVLSFVSFRGSAPVHLPSVVVQRLLPRLSAATGPAPMTVPSITIWQYFGRNLTLRHPLSFTGRLHRLLHSAAAERHVISFTFRASNGQLLVRGFNQQSSAFGSMAAVKTTRVKAQRSL
jgi:hypothetical protein